MTVVRILFLAVLFALVKPISTCAQIGHLQRGDSLFIVSFENNKIALIDTINVNFFKHEQAVCGNNLILLTTLGSYSYHLLLYETSPNGMVFSWEIFLLDSKCKELEINKLILAANGDLMVIYNSGSFKLIRSEEIKEFFSLVK
ncbi:MAG: hypothetical protein RL204_458 [Bacteroidota bacterium]|jgi:hypothetical protein